MISPLNISILNTGLPVAVLVLAAIVVPAGLGRHAASQTELALWLAVSCSVLFALGALIFAGTYMAEGTDVPGTFRLAPAFVLAYFARLSVLSAIIWGPVLALTWYVLAQGVERRRGQRISREGRS